MFWQIPHRSSIYFETAKLFCTGIVLSSEKLPTILTKEISVCTQSQDIWLFSMSWNDEHIFQKKANGLLYVIIEIWQMLYTIRLLWSHSHFIFCLLLTDACHSVIAEFRCRTGRGSGFLADLWVGVGKSRRMLMKSSGGQTAVMCNIWPGGFLSIMGHILRCCK